jgi:hypothetical protein
LSLPWIVSVVQVRQRARRAKRENLSSGIIATQTTALRVTNVIAHGPGIKLLDGLAEASTNGAATYAYRCRTLLFKTPAGLLTTQFLPVLALSADSWGYSWPGGAASVASGVVDQSCEASIQISAKRSEFNKVGFAAICKDAARR